MSKHISKVLVTGANGFVGQHLVSELKSEYQVVGITKKHNTKISLPGGVEYIEGDIEDKKFLQGVIQESKPDFVAHLAAQAHTWFYDVESIFRTNVMGTINLYDALLSVIDKDASYSPKILYVSSSEVYGHTSHLNDITEDLPCFPSNPYAASKLSADRLSYAYAQNKNLNIVIARPFTHTGPGQSLGFFVPDMAKQIIEVEIGKATAIRVGSLDTIRDYLDVRDVVRAYKMLLENKSKPGEVFNICSGGGIKMSSVLDKLLRIAGLKAKTETDQKRIRPSDTPVFVGSNKKIRQSIGWSPEISIDRTLADTLDYWRHISMAK